MSQQMKGRKEGSLGLPPKAFLRKYGIWAFWDLATDNSPLQDLGTISISRTAHWAGGGLCTEILR